jgi:hypothetical protein
MFGHDQELADFTSDSTKQGVVREGGDHDHGILCAIFICLGKRVKNIIIGFQ